MKKQPTNSKVYLKEGYKVTDELPIPKGSKILVEGFDGEFHVQTSSIHKDLVARDIWVESTRMVWRIVE